MPRPSLKETGRGRVLLAVALASLALPALGQSPAPSPEALPGLLEKQSPRPAWMGIRAAPGVHVAEVVAGGPAERAGLKKGDLITGVDWKSAIEEPGLMGALREKKPGDILVLDVLRDGQDLRLELELGEFPLDLLPEREAPRAPSPADAPPMPELPTVPGPGAVMRHYGQEERAFLGVTLQELTAGLAVYLGLPSDSPGVLVEKVHEDSPAARAGLRAGDVLLSVEGEDLRDMTQLGEMLRRRSPGDEINLSWWSRKGANESAVARLDARNKEIWVLSPPDREEQQVHEEVTESLKARLRMLEEQQRRLELEESSVKKALQELKEKSKR